MRHTFLDTISATVYPLNVMNCIIGRLLLVLLVIAPVLSADLGACCCPADRACCCAPASDCRETEIGVAPNLIWSQATLPPQSDRLIESALLATADLPSPLDLLHNQRPDLARSERPPPQRPPPLAAMTVLRL